VQSDDDVSLDLDLQFKGIGGQSFNGVPVITNRSYVGKITVKNGEPSAITGMVTDQNDGSTSGFPLVGNTPVVRGLVNQNSKNHSLSQILIVVTPHIIRKPYRKPGTGIYWNVAQ
jgi:Flp pilus assembly secretin CpaC